jgi:hypothetical protein
MATIRKPQPGFWPTLLKRDRPFHARLIGRVVTHADVVISALDGRVEVATSLSPVRPYGSRDCSSRDAGTILILSGVWPVPRAGTSWLT